MGMKQYETYETTIIVIKYLIDNLLFQLRINNHTMAYQTW